MVVCPQYFAMTSIQCKQHSIRMLAVCERRAMFSVRLRNRDAVGRGQRTIDQVHSPTGDRDGVVADAALGLVLPKEPTGAGKNTYPAPIAAGIGEGRAGQSRVLRNVSGFEHGSAGTSPGGGQETGGFRHLRTFSTRSFSP
jgi:hypothetical protein